MEGKPRKQQSAKNKNRNKPKERKKIKKEVKKDVRKEMAKIHSQKGLYDLQHSNYDRYFMAKLFPGKVDCQYMAGGHALNLPVKHARGTYVTSYDGANNYYVIFYSPTSVANSTARYAGFYISNTNNVTTSYTPAVFAGNTMATIYSGDFNAYSESGFVFTGMMKLTLAAPAATATRLSYSGRLNY